MQNYQAILIHPKVSGGRCSGLLHLTTDNICFVSEEVNYDFSINNLTIEAGGAGNRFIFLKDKTEENISIYTTDKSVLKDENLTSRKHFSEEIGQAKKTLNKMLVGTLTLLGIIAVLIISIYLLKDRMVKGLANQVPIKWEQEVGDKLFTSITLQHEFIKNDSLSKIFNGVAQSLFKQIEKEGYTVDVYFVKDPTINAFALPGGKVIVNSGLIEKANNWEEVMGVLGHELAHVTQRHHIRGVINNIGIFAILSATLGDVSALAGTFANLGGELASLSNSRAFENEADETGWNYLVQANINPSGLISFFKIIKKEYEPTIDSLKTEQIDLSFLSTHPQTEERIAHLIKKQQQLKQTFQPLPNTFKGFQEAIEKE